MWNGRKQKASSEVRGWLGSVQDRKLYFKQNLLRKSSPWKALLGKFLRIVKCVLCLGWWNSLLIQLKTKSRRIFSQSIHNESRKLWRTKLFLWDIDIGFSFRSRVRLADRYQERVTERHPVCSAAGREGSHLCFVLVARQCPASQRPLNISHKSINAAIIMLVWIRRALYQVQTHHHRHALWRPSAWGQPRRSM